MRQAIEEGFILDVLENYTTYKTYFELLKTIEDDPKYDRQKASSLLRNFVELHEHTINQKVAIIVEHFDNNIAAQINGKAKAMIVTRSRLHAVRYKLALDKYLKQNNYPYKTLVAFTGTVKDGGDFTETNMNTQAAGIHIPDTATAETFNQEDYRFLIVANKFQTGFDQPLLAAMYVDKKLTGVNAVQTLSRLNRIHEGKTTTVVLDFVNEASEIQKAFQPYYNRTLLNQGTDPNQLYDLQNQLDSYEFYEQKDLDNFAEVYFNPKGTQDKLYHTLAPVVERFEKAYREEQTNFYKKLIDYIRLYAFISQLLCIPDLDLEKFYEFARHLSRTLPIKGERQPLKLQEKIELKSYRILETHKGKINLENTETELSPIKASEVNSSREEEVKALSVIIDEINQRFGTNFSEDERVFIKRLETKLQESDSLNASVKINSPEKARMTFNNIADDLMQDMIETNFNFYKQFTDDQELKQMLLNFMFKRYTENQT